MNKVILLGRLTKDPEVRYTQSNTIFATFTVAVRKKFKSEDGVDADFINIITWNKTAEFVSMYFKKGMQIALAGRLQTRSYDAADGTKRYITEVVAEEVEFAESKKSFDNNNDAVSPVTKSKKQEKDIDFSELSSDEFKIDIDGTEDDLTFVE